MKKMMTKTLPRGTGLFAALVLLIAISAFASPHFLNPVNLLNVLRQVALYGILGVGMTFVILTRGIDLSVGSVVAFSGVLGATLMEMGVPIVLTVPVCLAAGTAMGAVNGLIISYWRMPAFIMTLASMVMIRGVGLMLADGGTVNPGEAAENFFWLGGGYVMGIPTPIYVFAAVCIVSGLILSYTPFGRAVFAVYTICGFLAALSGLIFLSRLSVGDPNSGLGLELEAITIAVIGGTSL